MPLTINRDLYAVKLTARAGQHNFNFNVNGDPSKRDGNIFTISGPPSTFDGKRKTGGTDIVGRYNSVFGSTLAGPGPGGASRGEATTYSGAGRDIRSSSSMRPSCRRPPAAGSAFFQDQDFNRDVVKGDVTMYLGGHDIKVGADWEHISAINNNFNGGNGQRITKRQHDHRPDFFYAHRFYVNDRAAGFVAPIRPPGRSRCR